MYNNKIKIVLLIVIGFSFFTLYNLNAYNPQLTNLVNRKNHNIINIGSSSKGMCSPNHKIILFEGWGCSQDKCGSLNHKSSNTRNFKNTNCISNDEAQSVAIVNGAGSFSLVLGDDPNGSSGDDYIVINWKGKSIDSKDGEAYCIECLEGSYEDDYVEVTYHKKNGLGGKVSYSAIN